MPGPRLKTGNILDTVRLTVAGFSDNLEQVGVSLECFDVGSATFQSVAAHGPLPVIELRYDPEQISRALFNLISNAVSASSGLEDAKSVVVRVQTTQGVRAEIEISVIDTGHGVPEAVRERIFEPYFSTKRTGTGLGLVIVQQIVHEHGGRLWVSANEPRGTIFSIALPA
jgi:two-component system nitrogen regulation sensor histidine kinase NtrY